MANEGLKRFSDEYPKETVMQFDAKEIDTITILNEDIVIRDVVELTGEHGEFLVILADFKGEEVQFATGSKVIVPKIKKAKKEEKLPLIAKIVKKKSKNDKTYLDIE